MKQRCRQLRNDRRHTSHYTSEDIGVTKPRKMRWVGHVLSKGDLVIEFRISIRKYSDTFWRVILRQIYRMWRCKLGLSDEGRKTHAAFVNMEMNTRKDRRKLGVCSPPQWLLGAEGWLRIVWLRQTHSSAYSSYRIQGMRAVIAAVVCLRTWLIAGKNT
jgi:hypothetical protein